MTITAAKARTNSESPLNAGNSAYDVSPEETKECRQESSSDGSPSCTPRRVFKRIAQACDRCRFKKARCTGGALCFRCYEDGSVCVTTPRPHAKRHSVHSDYISLIKVQRDQLYQAIARILVEEDDVTSTRIRALLQNMGINIDTVQSPGTVLKDNCTPVPFHRSTDSANEIGLGVSDNTSISSNHSSLLDPVRHSMSFESTALGMDVLHDTTEQDWSHSMSFESTALGMDVLHDTTEQDWSMLNWMMHS